MDKELLNISFKKLNFFGKIKNRTNFEKKALKQYLILIFKTLKKKNQILDHYHLQQNYLKLINL